MPRPRSFRPTDGELEILQVVWRLQSATIRDVHDELSKIRPIASTTVATMMQVMLRKKLLTVVDKRRPQKYRAVSDQDATSMVMLSDLVRRLFGGSVKQMALQLLSQRTPPKKRAQIEKLLDDLE